jgi:hypothetical protein
MSEKSYAESVFIDSGAFSLYAQKVLGGKEEKIGRNGRVLAKPVIRWNPNDFSYYDLKKGSEFRRYCDSYAAFMKAMQGKGLIFANVDVILNPDLTWEVQRFFEEEHGLSPMPVVHYGTPLKYVDRYLRATVIENDAGDIGPRYDMLGVGGSAQAINRNKYLVWADELFSHVCPKSNGCLPLIKMHGFALTSWKLIRRYPWFSVDSATWIKMSAYGVVYIPRWTKEKGFRFDRPPMIVNFSSKSPTLSKGQDHYSNAILTVRKSCDMWLEHLGLKLGSCDADGEVVELGVTSHYKMRCMANLRYLKALEASCPAYPHVLDHSVVDGCAVRYSKGFGL